SQGEEAGWPWRRLYTRTIVSSARSGGGLKEEIIPAHLGFPRSGGRPPDKEFGGKHLVPGYEGTGADEDSFPGIVQNNQPLESEGLGPVRGKLNTVSGLNNCCFFGAHAGSL